MLSHYNLISNVYQFLGQRATPLNSDDNILCFLPLYHIYGLNVMLNPALILGATLVLMPRFNVRSTDSLLTEESITMMPLVPPAMNALCLAAEAGQFPKNHKLTWVKSGAAPLAPELPRRFTALTGILVCQGYGMTEASPVTHCGFLEPELYRPDSIGHPLALTECRVIGAENLAASAESAAEVRCGRARRVGDARTAIHAGLLERAGGDGCCAARWMVLVGRRCHARPRGFLPGGRPSQGDDQVQRISLWLRRRWKRCCWSIRRCGSAEWWDGPMRRRARFRWRLLPCAMGLRLPEDGRRVVRIRRRPADPLQTAAGSAFCGGRPQDGLGKDSAARVAAVDSVS